LKKPELYLTSWLFLRLLAIVYFFAFVSALIQMPGLLGEQGILPVADFLRMVSEHTEVDRYLQFPTIFWLNSSVLFLQAICLAGCVLSLLLVAGIFPGAALFILWFFYLSIVTVGQTFYTYQWDILLLEAGFLACFLFPWRSREPWLASTFLLAPVDRSYRPSKIVIWLFRILLFKLMFMSGLVKLTSGDLTWQNLTALDYHFYTQPLPTPLAFFAQAAPPDAHKVACAVMLSIELVAPFLIFLGRRARVAGAILFTFLQVLILLTGNYTFFNLLTIALSLQLLDDPIVERLLPASLSISNRASAPARGVISREQLAHGMLVGCLLLMIGFQYVSTFAEDALPPTLQGWARPFARFYLVNTYGLFAIMTTERMEIEVEGTDDGANWLPYEFPFKPGILTMAPPIVAPYQPRLDWQMWFAALGSYESNPWFLHFMERLLEGSPPVLSLLKSNPFPNHPPRSLRASFYRYQFATPQQLQATGHWWTRQFVQYYLPPIGLKPTFGETSQ
jgi:uncharacterized membrane protein YphA (DoxX/SURF4 family)